MSKENQLVIKRAEDIQLRTDGTPVLENLDAMKLWAGMMIRSEFLPKSYTKESQVVAAMQMASELGLKAGINTLKRTSVINGSPAIWGDLPLSLVYQSKLLSKLEAYFIDKKGKKICPENNNLFEEKFGFYCLMKRVNGVEYADHYTLDMAKKAGLGNVWNKHPDDMLRNRTTGKVIKFVFPDVINGASIAEYDFDTMPDPDKKEVDLSHMNDNLADMGVIDSFTDSGEIEDAEIIDLGSIAKESAPIEPEPEPFVADEIEEAVINVPDLPEVNLEEIQNIEMEKLESTAKEVIQGMECEAVEEEVFENADLTAPFGVIQKQAIEVARGYTLPECSSFRINVGELTGKKISDLSMEEMEALYDKMEAHVKKKWTEKKPISFEIVELYEVLKRTIKILGA